MTQICPHCKKGISAVELKDIDVRVNMQSKWRWISYVCPYCNNIISVSIDPIAIKSDIIDWLFSKLKNK